MSRLVANSQRSVPLKDNPTGICADETKIIIGEREENEEYISNLLAYTHHVYENMQINLQMQTDATLQPFQHMTC